MKRVILHIGTMKTGSSALQHFLVNNQDWLNKMNAVYYQPCMRYRNYPGKTNGDFLDMFFESGYSQHLDGDERILIEDKEKDNLKQAFNTYSTIIISDELLWGRSKEYWEKVISLFEECAKEDVEIRFLVYLRRQDDYLISSWKENVRSRFPKVGNCSISRWIARRAGARDFDYNQVLKDLEDVVGIAHIDVRLYDKEKLIREGIAHNFFQKFHGFSKPSSIPKEIGEYYSSYSTEITYALDAINTILVRLHLHNNYTIHRKIRSAADNYSKTHKTIRENDSALSIEERLMILRKYEKGNSAIARRYFNKNSLFSRRIDQKDKVPISKQRNVKIGISILLRALLINK